MSRQGSKRAHNTHPQGQGINVLRGCIIERAGEEAEPLFVSNRNKRLSRDAE